MNRLIGLAIAEKLKLGESYRDEENLDEDSSGTSSPEFTSVDALNIEDTIPRRASRGSFDDDTASIMTFDTVEEDFESEKDLNIYGDEEESSNTEYSKSLTKKRGWSLFGNKHAVSHRSGTMSSLGRIMEHDDNADNKSGEQGFLTAPRSSRKKSQDSIRSSSAEIRKSRVGSRASIASNEEQPAVKKWTDEFSRDILIKNFRKGKYEITAGTIESLVQSLAEDAPADTIYIEIFLLTFRHFSNPLEVLGLLQNRFQEDYGDEKKNSIIKMRVIAVLKKWAERHFYDFRSNDLRDKLNDFFEIIRKSECESYSGKLEKNLNDKLENEKDLALTLSRLTIDASPESISEKSELFLRWDPKSIAESLTVTDLELFKKIEPQEFCIFLWGQKADPLINNLNGYIGRFNRVGFWVSTTICSQKNLKKRVEIMDKYLIIMKHLLKWNNYNSLMAVLSGLNTTSVSRLKKTWEQVKKSKNFSIMREVETKMSYVGNFRHYREIEAVSELPFLPFFGLYIKDLTFMNDGNQKILTRKNLSNQKATQIEAPNLSPLINFEKCRSIIEKVQEIRRYQQSVFDFNSKKVSKKDKKDEMEAYFRHPNGPPAIQDEKVLHEMSLKVEPRSPAKNEYTVSSDSSLKSDDKKVPRSAKISRKASNSSKKGRDKANDSLKTQVA